jgi:hypothetical protein
VLSISPYRLFSGLSLLILLGIPTFVPALHEILHYHQHLNCVEVPGDVHLHADIYACELCDYLSTFTFLDDQIDVVALHQETFADITYSWTDLFVQTHRGTPHLRGPPV